MKTKNFFGKRALSLLFTLLMVISLVPFSAFSVFAEETEALSELSATIDTGESITLKDVDSDGYYDISNADELYAFAALVNGGNKSINVELTQSIIVNNVLLDEDTTDARVWTPIGNYSNKYSGTFDGNGCVIIGLYINDSSAANIGLFGYIGAKGVVKNTEVNAHYFCAYDFVGGIAGVNDGVIIDCINYGCVIGNNMCVGGMAGTNKGEIINCHNNTVVTGLLNVGGIVGYNYRGKITGSYSSGDVNASGSCVGGVVGDNYEGEINNCYNTGAVDGHDLVGGVVGNSDGTVTNCYSAGEVSGVICLGGICGKSYSGTIANCYYLNTAYDGGINGEDADGSAEAKTAEQFASGEVAYLLQGEQDDIVWGQLLIYSSTAEDFPALFGERVYKATDCIGNVIYSNTSDNAQHQYKAFLSCEKCGYCHHMRITNHYCRNCNTYITNDILEGYSIGLGDNISVSYYMTFCEETLNDRNAKVVLTVPDTNKTNTVEIPVSSVTPNADGYYVFTCEVAAKEMTSVITAQVKTSVGESSFYEYTVQDYAEDILSDTETYAKEQALVKAMLNYGASAQTYLDYKTYSLANDTEYMSDEEKVVNLYGFEGAGYTLEGETAGVKYYGTALSLESELAFKHYFIIDSSVNVDELTIDCKYDAKLKKSGNLYELKISGIPAHQVATDVTVKLGNTSLTYSIASYGELIQNNGDTALWTVVSALTDYSFEASLYANK